MAYLIPAANGLAYGLLLFTVAAGLTLVFGVADVLNLAHGTVYVAGGYVAVAVSDGTWGGLALGVLAGAGAGAVAGVVLSAALTPLSGRGHLSQALLTFGLALMGGALLESLFGADDVRPVLPGSLDGAVSLAGQRFPAYRLGFIAVAAVLALAGWYVVTRTRAGALVRAVVDDREMVAMLGVNPRAVTWGVLAVGGLLAGLAGALGAPILGPGPGTASQVLLLSLIVVVVGGLRSIPGAFAAAIGVGQVQSVGVVAAPWLAPYLLFAAMGVALLVRGWRGGVRAVVGR